MNKKLLLALYDRSGLGAYMPVDYKGQELEVEKHWEKFAELIVRECAAEADKQTIYCRGIPWGRWIKEHFGVDK